MYKPTFWKIDPYDWLLLGPKSPHTQARAHNHTHTHAHIYIYISLAHEYWLGDVTSSQFF